MKALSTFAVALVISVTAITALFLLGSAHAQSTQFYGPGGQYEGQAITQGNSTQFYGPGGQYQGQAIAPGGFGNGGTQFYGPGGQYQGQTWTTTPRFTQPQMPTLPTMPSFGSEGEGE